MDVVSSPDHHLHDNLTEFSNGVVHEHWERPIRADVIAASLRERPDAFRFVEPTKHDRAPIEAVHDPGLVDFLSRAWHEFQTIRPQREIFPDTFLHPAIRENMTPASIPTSIDAQFGYWCFEAMTPLLEGTFAAASAAVDIALTATDLVLGGAPVAYGLCRPPGHHAPRSAYGGYCYFNNAAVSAHAIASSTGTRVAVLDVDYHHGNGTQQIFYERDDVHYLSIHGDPNRAYPYFIGHPEETGAGRGLGRNTNLALAADVDDDAYAAALAQALDVIDAFDPSTIVVSLGVDTFESDPIGDFALTENGFRRHGAMVAALRRPLVVLQEGGYHVPSLGTNVRAWLEGCIGPSF